MAIEYQFNQLDKCIYDYLVYNANKYMSSSNIFKNLTNKNNTHFCYDLEENKLKFLVSCYTLCDKFKNINVKISDDIIFVAFINNFEETIIDHCYDVDTSIITNDFRNINKSDIIDELCDSINLDKLDNSKIYDNKGNTLLHLIAETNKVAKFRDIIKYGFVNLNILNKYNETPIIVAYKYGNIDILYEMMNYANLELSNDIVELNTAMITKNNKYLLIKDRINNVNKLNKKYMYLFLFQFIVLLIICVGFYCNVFIYN